jgi:hypothetical protein
LAIGCWLLAVGYWLLAVEALRLAGDRQIAARYTRQQKATLNTRLLNNLILMIETKPIRKERGGAKGAERET